MGRIYPPIILGSTIKPPAPADLNDVLAAQIDEANRLENAWEEWHRTFGVMQRDAGRQVWALACGIRDAEPLGPTPAAALAEARRRALNGWRTWARVYPDSMTADSYEVTEAIIQGHPWQPFLQTVTK